MQITGQARQLLLYCLEHGGDPNLPTTDAAKTVYHLALVAPRPDQALLARMLELGANVNHADVHNTTPLMDVIALGDEARARQELGALLTSGRALLLDSQNCSLQSALWRAMHQGQPGLVRDLVSAGAAQVTGACARVEPVPRPSSSARLPRQEPIKVGVPSLLAPFLSDSPVTANLHVRLPRRRYGRVEALEYSALATEHTGRTLVAPVVDRGWLQGPGVTERVATLVRQNTAHPVAGDASVVEPAAVVPLMFGEVSAGLRQLAVRALLRQVLFSRSPAETLTVLDTVCRRSGFYSTCVEVAPSQTRVRRAAGSGGGEILRQEYELELGDELELSYTEVRPIRTSTPEPLDPLVLPTPEERTVELALRASARRAEEEMERRERRATNFEDALDEVEDMTEILDTLDKLDRELEVVRTDCALQALDRDLATWEEELEGTLARITRYQEELRTLQLPGRREASSGAAEARRRSEQLIEELRSQRLLLEGSEVDLASAERVMGGEVEELAQCMDSLQLEGGLLQARLERRRLDENWSLGSSSRLEEEQEVSPRLPGMVSPQHSTERLVRSLQVSVSVREPPPPPVRASSLPSPPEGSSSGDEGWSQSWGLDTPASPGTMASNLVTLNSRLFQQRRRIGASAVLEPPPTPPPGLICSSSEPESDDDTCSSGSSSDSDTWGGTFSLRHTQSLRPVAASPPGDATVVARLTPRTLGAITDSLGVPEMLRPCFALEAARLQLGLALARHQAVGCDRNCEGEESESDSEEDWLASEESDDQTEEGQPELEAPEVTSDGGETSEDEDDGGSIISEFSQSSRRSWLGSQPNLAAGAGSISPPSSSPALSVASSSSAWLPDREDLRRMRSFLAASPGSDFQRSTDSEED